MITRLHSDRAGSAGRVTAAVRLALALVMGASFAVPAAIPASATELKMPSAKSRLLRDRDDVTVIIIDRDRDHRRSRSTSPERLDLDAVPRPSNSKIRRADDDRIYIKRKSAGGSDHQRTKEPGPKVIIVDKNRGSSCSGSGVCVIRP